MQQRHDLVITFVGTHAAIMGEQVLLASGLPVRVMPLPSRISAGCGICLRVAEADLAAALARLKLEKVDIEAVYRQEAGCFEKIWPEFEGYSSCEGV